jgi:hypothetical protein
MPNYDGFKTYLDMMYPNLSISTKKTMVSDIKGLHNGGRDIAASPYAYRATMNAYCDFVIATKRQLKLA